MEKSTENLKNKIEIERKSTADVKSTNLNLEEKVNELEKVLDENIDLRKSVTDLKSRLEEADVRIEVDLFPKNKND